MLFRTTLALLLAVVVSRFAGAQEIPLRDEDGKPTERLIEILLAPGEFPDQRIVHISENDEALYCLDSSLAAATPFVQVYPERIPWPSLGGVALKVESEQRRLVPVGDWVTDAILDEGFAIRWTFLPLGLRFDTGPAFAVTATSAEVFSTKDGRTLMRWENPPPRPVCTAPGTPGLPACDLEGISREVRSVSVSPDGSLATLGITGIKPRLELYRVDNEPRLMWQSLFPSDSGGVIETGFSADGRFVVALLGNGAIHRFNVHGGQHMVIPSKGRTARSVPPGDTVLVGGDSGDVTLWRLADGTIEWRLPAQKARGPVDRLAVSGDGARIAAMDYDNGQAVIRIWDLSRRKLILQLSLADDHLADMAFDFTGQRLYLSHEQDGLMAARVEKGATVEKVGTDGQKCRSAISWIEPRHHLACSVEGGVMEFDQKGLVARSLTTGIAADNWRIAVSGNGMRMVAVSDGHLLLW